MTIGVDPGQRKPDVAPQLPRVVGTVWRPGLTAAVSATTFAVAPVTGHYRLSMTLQVTTAGNAVNLTGTGRAVASCGAIARPTAALACNALGDTPLVTCFEALYGQPITWETALSGAIGAGVYSVRVTLEVLT